MLGDSGEAWHRQHFRAGSFQAEMCGHRTSKSMMLNEFSPFFKRFGDRVFSLLPLLYLLWSLPFLFAIALIVPPGGQADEPERFARAAHVSAGGMVADKQSIIKVDPAIEAIMQPFASARFRPEIKATAAQFAAA